MALMLSTPAYTQEMAQRGQFSTDVPVPGGGSLFDPQGPLGGDRIASPVSTEYVGTSEDAPAIEAFMLANGITDISQGRKAYYSQQQQPSPYGNLTPGQALGGAFTMQSPTPVQQLNSPSLEQIAQTPPPSTGPRMVNGQFVDSVFGHPLLPHELTADMRAQMAAYQPSVPMMTQPPETQQVVAQIQAPVTNMPTTPVPVPQAPPQTQQLLRQIAAPVMTRTAPRPQQPAMSMRAPAPVQTDRLAPIRQSLAQLRPLRTQQPAVQPRRPAPISRVQPRLLPTPPMGRR